MVLEEVALAPVQVPALVAECCDCGGDRGHVFQELLALAPLFQCCCCLCCC